MDNGSTKEIKPRSAKTHPEKIERDAFEAWVAKHILSGYSQSQLEEKFREDFPETTTSRKRINNALKKLRTEWLASSQEDTNFYMARELEKLDVMEEEAWRMYRSVGGTTELQETKEFFGPDGNIRESLVATKTKDNSSIALQWFKQILKIQTDRRKVLRLETVVNINNVMAVKGYAVFNPTKDWPDNKLPEPNVIDAEFMGSD